MDLNNPGYRKEVNLEGPFACNIEAGAEVKYQSQQSKGAEVFVNVMVASHHYDDYGWLPLGQAWMLSFPAQVCR